MDKPKRVATHPLRTERRERAAKVDSGPRLRDMTSEQLFAQIKKLDMRLGEGKGASRERARIKEYLVSRGEKY